MNCRRVVRVATCVVTSLCIALILGADTEPYSYRYTPNPFCLPYGETQANSYHPYFDQPVDNGYVIDADAWGLNNADYNNDKICMADPRLADAFAIGSSTEVVRSHRFDGIAGYPNISEYPSSPILVSQLGDTTTSWSFTTDPSSSGAWDAAVDVLYSPAPTAAQASGDGHCDVEYPAGARSPEHWGGEVMIWLSSHHADKPAGTWLTDLSVDGVRYSVWRRPASSLTWSITSFVRMPATTSVTNLNIGAFTRDAVMFSNLPTSLYLCKVSAGFELWQGGSGLATDSFSVKDAVLVPSAGGHG